MKKEKNFRFRTAIAVFAVLLAISIGVAVLWLLRTTFSAAHSPSGAYAVAAAWTDKGGFGYSGKIYFADCRRPIPRLYDTGYTVPASYGFLSDGTFYIMMPDGESVTFEVRDFIRDP